MKTPPPFPNSYNTVEIKPKKTPPPVPKINYTEKLQKRLSDNFMNKPITLNDTQPKLPPLPKFQTINKQTIFSTLLKNINNEKMKKKKPDRGMINNVKKESKKIEKMKCDETKTTFSDKENNNVLNTKYHSEIKMKKKQPSIFFLEFQPVCLLVILR